MPASSVRRHLSCVSTLHKQARAQLGVSSGYDPGDDFEEVGHGGETMVRRVYGQPGQARHRAEVVEYRMEQHAAKLEAGWRPCGALGSDTALGTTA